ncbi:MAG: FG-GAP repeat protein [Candidatus Uhrbacteria bacterium GW2011_GWD2_52_7]|uniref:FG-GAP repeat protein n=1 Tax=Candidatus Uhrbacteria bacterium GW2011_GWD2_52_7 TaxID=1618989 RepID=A0A0G1ZQY2_9BACT|nr:MAG: FG-GAP repeat protein [Candidatus Uhrbacteria bacterium GW2011_GWD2_52_7]
MNIAASDDFAVGGTSLVAPFSVDESLNVVRIGDGANDANDPKITFYASDATDSGTLSYADSDTFAFEGGYLTHAYAQDQSALVADWYKSLFGSTNIINTSGAGVDLDISAVEAAANYSGALGAGSSTNVYSLVGQTLIDAASAVLTQGIGVLGTVTNQSTNVAAVNGAGYLAGGEFSVTHSSAQTISSAYGVYSYLEADAGTITTGTAVSGEVLGGAGSFTTGYGGRFLNLNEGATRYGVYAEASGGATANYAGYFASGLVQIDADVTADAMTFATGAGDLAVADGIENHGGGRFGDVNDVDDFIFTTAVTTTPGIQMVAGQLTSGTGLTVLRADDGGATAFSGKLVNIGQHDTTSGAGMALNVIQSGTGDAIAVRIAQDTVADQTNGAGGTTIGGQALVLETLEAGSNDDIMLIRSNGQVVLAIETDGSVLSDNGYSAAGADYAEYFPTTDTTLGFYEVTCVDETESLSVKRCEAGNQNLVGVISSDPGFIGNMPQNGATGNVLVGMVGQIDTYVNADEGAIEIGDPISTSSTRAGYGAKAQGPARIIGFALESRTSGTGIIKVLVQPQWYGGDVLSANGSAMQVSTDIVMAPLTDATALSTSIASHGLSFRGSVWMGSAAVDRQMSIETSVSATDDYRLSVQNSDGNEVVAISDDGDLVLTGKLYPSDRGAAQQNRYMYYDGSAGPGGDFMRTNASGWATGSYDFAEMFPSPDALSPGEVVVFGDAKEAVKRSPSTPYFQAAGVVSTRPGFLAGENVSGSYPIALAGRVPTYVSGENGAIAIGDPLTTSTRPGYAMKATEAGPIIGYATESFAGTTGSIIVYINVSYFDGGPTAEGPAAENTVSELAINASAFDLSGTINLNGGNILSVASLEGIGNNWRLEEDGDFVTHGRLVQLIQSFQGEDVETYASASRQMTIELTGTSMLESGTAVVRFDEIDPLFNDIISPTAPYRVFLTPYAATGALYAAERTGSGFVIRDVGGANEVMVDWMVVAVHKDYEMIEVERETPSTPQVEIVIEDTVSEPVVTPSQESEFPEATLNEPSEEVSEVVEDALPTMPDSSTSEADIVTIPDVLEPVSEPVVVPLEP